MCVFPLSLFSFSELYIGSLLSYFGHLHHRWPFFLLFFCPFSFYFLLEQTRGRKIKPTSLWQWSLFCCACHTKWRFDCSSQTSQQYRGNQWELLLISCRTAIKAMFHDVLLWQRDNSPTLAHLSGQFPVQGFAFWTLSCCLYFSLFDLSPSDLPPDSLTRTSFWDFKNRCLKIRTLHKSVESLRHMENGHNKSFFLLCPLHYLWTPSNG